MPIPRRHTPMKWHQARHKFCKSLEGKRVRVYYNLHRRCLSVVYRGLVIGYVDEIKLSNARFLVSDKGRQRVLRSGSKNVHAYVEGTLTSWLRRSPRTLCTYDPYRYSSFVVRSTERPIYQAGHCHVIGKKILIR